ncbi:hypothetical protein KC340_g80 [Hortaea werneckii]|nr:hypothetical protein KC340_g80 [Hortaea werneckii]
MDLAESTRRAYFAAYRGTAAAAACSAFPTRTMDDARARQCLMGRLRSHPQHPSATHHHHVRSEQSRTSLQASDEAISAGPSTA